MQSFSCRDSRSEIDLAGKPGRERRSVLNSEGRAVRITKDIRDNDGDNVMDNADLDGPHE